MPDNSSDLSTARYGGRAPKRARWKTIALGVALGLLVAWSVWAGLFHSDKPIKWSLRTYEVISAKQVDVTITLYRKDGKAAECTVYAQAHDHSIVGERTIQVPKGKETLIVPGTIATERKAVNGVVKDCRLVD